MGTKKLLSWVGVTIVIILAIIIAVNLFAIAVSRSPFTKNMTAQKAQVTRPQSNPIQRVQFKQYSAPANLTVY